MSFSTFWHAKGGLQMCVLGRAMNFFGPQSRGGAIAPSPPPLWIRHCVGRQCQFLTRRSNSSQRTRNSTIADKLRDAFRDINLWKILWPSNWGYGHWRSFETSPFDTAHVTSYWCSMVTMALSCVVSEIFNVAKMLWPWNPGSRSLKVIDSGTIR